MSPEVKGPFHRCSERIIATLGVTYAVMATIGFAEYNAAQNHLHNHPAYKRAAAELTAAHELRAAQHNLLYKVNSDASKIISPNGHEALSHIQKAGRIIFDREAHADIETTVDIPDEPHVLFVNGHPVDDETFVQQRIALEDAAHILQNRSQQDRDEAHAAIDDQSDSGRKNFFLGTGGLIFMTLVHEASKRRKKQKPHKRTGRSIWNI